MLLCLLRLTCLQDYRILFKFVCIKDQAEVAVLLLKKQSPLSQDGDFFRSVESRNVAEFSSHIADSFLLVSQEVQDSAAELLYGSDVSGC